MDVQDAIDLTRQAVWISLIVSAPMLMAGLVVGLVVGLLQALTQIQEQTVAFVPKVVAMVLAMTLAMPWLLARMCDYLRDLLINLPETL